MGVVLHISRASDLKNKKERFLYRLLEIFPGFLSYGTFALFVFLSFYNPFFVAVFIILFALFWLFRMLHFSFYVKYGFDRLKNNIKINWYEKLKKLNNSEKIYHLVVVPCYKESYEILKDTINSIYKDSFPNERTIVCVTVEELAEDKERIISKLKEDFEGKFLKFIITVHPKDLMCGKAANENWGAKKAKEFIDNISIQYENIIYTSLDADTIVSEHYFSCVAFKFLTCEKPLRSAYQPIPFFLNNIFEVPFFSRVFSFSATMWNIRCQERGDKLITFSSHSMPFKALVDVGFKTEKVVSDDSRIFFQCFFKYDGDWRTIPLFYPVSMDSNAASSAWKTFINMYKQQRRWAYGVTEIPYFIFNSLRNKNIPLRKKISFAIELIEVHWTWATAPILILSLGFLPVYFGGENFTQTVLSYNLPNVVSTIVRFSMVGMVVSALFSIFILMAKQFKLSSWKMGQFFAEWIITPFLMIFFSALPALDAQARLMLGRYMGFWPTEKVRNKKHD